jgi:hypothetical protein
MPDPLSANDPIYDVASDVYARGDVVLRPPPAPDFEGLPPRPPIDTRRDARIDIANLEAELGAAREEEEKATAALATLRERQVAEQETPEWRGLIAELLALDREETLMQDAFPADRRRRQAELRSRVERDPERLRAALGLAVDQAASTIRNEEGRLIAERARAAQLDAAEALYNRRELEHAARLVYWGIAGDGDVRRLTEGGVDAAKVPKRKTL